MRKSLLLALLGLFVWVIGPAWADPQSRIFIDTVEYTGPTMSIDGHPAVNAERFARTAGWFVRKTDSGLAMADSDSRSGPADHGLNINGTPFSGATQMQDGALFVSLSDLASFLHGSLKELTAYHTIKVAIPGMPSALLTRAVEHRMVAVAAQGYTLVEYYATW